MYAKIVVGTDGSPTAAAAVDHARKLAKAFGSALHVVSAYRVPSVVGTGFGAEGIMPLQDAEWREAAENDVKKLLGDVAQGVSSDGLTVETHAMPGDPVKAICSVAEAVKADLIVVGNKGMHGVRRLLGSVPNSVAHAAPCSVLIVETTAEH